MNILIKRILPWLVIGVCFFTQYALAQPPIPVIFDTDMASDCDDAGALAVLHALADLGEAEILAVVTNRKDKGNASAAAVDVINTYYGRPDIPIGTDKDGAKIASRNPSSFTGILRDRFSHDCAPDYSMPDALTVYRKTLAAQEDGSVVLCSVGALSNLEDLLRSGPDTISPSSGSELILTKVKQTVIMGGGFPRTARPETNLRLDPPAAIAVTNEWPGAILWQGYEVGAALYTGAELKALSDTNPIKIAFASRPFRGISALEAGKPSHDQAAVLLAVRGIEPDYWQLTKGGRVVIDSDGHSQWTTDRPTDHAFVSIKSHPRDLTSIIARLMTVSPKTK